MQNLKNQTNNVITVFSALGIVLSLILRYAVHAAPGTYQFPIFLVLGLGGLPLLYDLTVKISHREITSDILAGISIVTAVFLREYLAGAFVVLMLASGAALEGYAVERASSVLRALAKRMPSIAHRRQAAGNADIAVPDIAVGDLLLIYPHENCPVDGVVIEGNGTMDESFLTGEPFKISKTPGSEVISGAINGPSLLVIRAVRSAVDSRYAKIMEVMRDSEQKRPKLRRLGDQLGAVYAPLALALAFAGWYFSGEAHRFLAILVVATPCPLIIAIPVAIIGSVTLCARRSIIVKNPAVMEQINTCRTVIFDKTGTLTFGRAKLTEQLTAPGYNAVEVLGLVADLEQYSKHPLAEAVLEAARAAHLTLLPAAEISEKPGQGLRGTARGRRLQITRRDPLEPGMIPGLEHLPPAAGGLECHVLIDGAYAATYRFHDEIRPEGRSFIRHLGPKHQFERELILSGDRESEVRYLADEVGISQMYAQKTPEEKLAIVRDETKRAKTLYIGDGINDAPALMAATVGIAIGHNSDITSESAGVVIMDSSLHRADEFMHISRRMRRIALESAVGGIVLSFVGMIFAAGGALPPVAGAIAQEIIDILAILNALRAAFPPGTLSDY